MGDYAQEFNSAYLGRWIYRNGLSILYVGSLDDTAEVAADSQNLENSCSRANIVWRKLCTLSTARDDK